MGKTLRWNHASASFRSGSESSAHGTRAIPCSARAGRRCWRSASAWRCPRCSTMARIRSMIWAGVIASGTGPVTPISIWRRRTPTRFMKNSSRLLEKIARKRTRSRSGVRASRATSRTRRLNSSHSTSRLRKRAGSPGGGGDAASGAVPDAAAAPGAAGAAGGTEPVGGVVSGSMRSLPRAPGRPSWPRSRALRARSRNPGARRAGARRPRATR